MKSKLPIALYFSSVAFAFAQTYREGTPVHRDTKTLDEVVVRGHSPIKQLQRSPYNAVALDASTLRGRSLSVSEALDKLSGVKIRVEGGLGSNAQINLSGFTGRHVRVFLDGIPLDGSGSSLSLSNLPLSQAERVEVYKGVVPIELGMDALGGAINIVSRRGSGAMGGYTEASVSYGSYHTLRSDLSVGYRFARGPQLRLSLYQLSSHNDYKVYTEYLDLSTQTIADEEGVFRRFHDHYHAGGVLGELRWSSLSWADQLVLSMRASLEKADVQHANLMSIAFGQKERKASALVPSLSYRKSNLLPHLDLQLSLRYQHSMADNIDTASRRYSWTGEWIPTQTIGESETTVARYGVRSLYATLGARYHLGAGQTLALHNLYSYYRRHIPWDDTNRLVNRSTTFMRRSTHKDIWGLSYTLAPTRRWHAMLLGKGYFSGVTGPVLMGRVGGKETYGLQTINTTVWGYGGGFSYTLLPHLQLKTSYERTLRLPTERELFGDGDLEIGETKLRPERSHNINLGLLYSPEWGQGHSAHVELNMLYRSTEDYIIRTITSKGTAISRNHGLVRGLATEVTAHYYWRDILSLGGDLSYQDMRNRESLTVNGAPSLIYGDRLPNLPYLYGHADASYTLRGIFADRDRLSLQYTVGYVHEFFRSWQSEGGKLVIPRQLWHDIELGYTTQGERYRLALECHNLADARLYDDYSLQKPGRSVSLKLHCFLRWSGHGARDHRHN